MPVNEILDGFVQSSLSGWLRSKGFGLQASPSSPGVSFFRSSGGTHPSVVQIIDFQVGRGSTTQTCLFTVNFGIYSRTIGLFEPGKVQKGSSVPPIIEWHWRERIGFLMPGKVDLWWTIRGRRNTRGEVWEAGLIR